MTSQFKLPKLMAIINITPDSFSGDGLINPKDIVTKAERFLEEGADILDIGAESSRPGNQELTSKEELARLLPILPDLLSLTKEISIDTYHPETAEAILNLGPVKINSIWGIQRDTTLAEIVAKHNSELFLMHNCSDQAKAQIDPKLGGFYKSNKITNKNIIKTIKNGLQEQIQKSKALGLSDSQIIIDPGLGFGKTPSENLLILKELRDLKELNYPILIGASRKSFLGINQNLAVNQRLEGSLAAALIATLNGADYLRVHDLLATKRHLELAENIYNA